MTKITLRYLSLVAVLAWSVGPAFAQSSGADLKKSDSGPPSGEGQKPQDGVKQEPSSKGPGAGDQTAVLIDGKLAVPGAPPDVDSVPSKYSARNAADDKLSIAAYRLKGLSAEQRSDLYSQLSGQPTAGGSSGDTEISAVVGAQVPSNVVLDGSLKPLPAAAVDKVPELKGIVYATSAGKVVLVDATTRTVVGVVTK
jgi:hypothetical protein